MDDSILDLGYIDKYRILSLLGEGGMGRVYLGYDPDLDRRVALKVVQRRKRDEPRYIEQFRREARAIARLNHPHIVTVYGYEPTGAYPYMVMEYIEGRKLKDRVAPYQAPHRSFPPGDALALIRQVCQALDYAHKRGVIHRDVKPANIIIDQNDKAILVDFGLAVFDQKQMSQHKIQGTPQYISPEQANPPTPVLPQSDLYAVGVILYEMFTGQWPFYDTDSYKLALLHLEAPPPRPRDKNPYLSPAIEAVILKALEKEPQDRYQSGGELVAALDRAIRKNDPPPEPLSTETEILSSPPSPRPRKLSKKPFDELLFEFRRGNVALFCGEGISTFKRGIPSYRQLAHALAENIGLKKSEKSTLPEVAQKYEVVKSRHELIALISKLISRPSFQYLPTHELIAALPIRRVVTVNWDNLLEQALHRTDKSLDIIINDDDNRYKNPQHIWLIKLYGSCQRPSSLVITREDHTRLLAGSPGVANLVSSFFNQYTPLFVGFDLADPDFGQLYNQLSKNLGQPQRPGYAVQQDLDVIDQKVWARKGVRVIEVATITFLQRLQTHLSK